MEGEFQGIQSVYPRLVIPVEGDRTEVEDGGRAAEDVEGEPGLADEAAEHPPRRQMVKFSHAVAEQY